MTDANKYLGTPITAMGKQYDVSQFANDSLTGNAVVDRFIDMAVAKAVKPFDSEGNHISAGYEFDRVVDGDSGFANSAAACKNIWLCVPNINVPDSVKNLGFNQEDGTKYKWKTVEEVNKIADEIDKIPDAHQLVQFLSDAYKQTEIFSLLHPKLQKAITEYRDKYPLRTIEDYADLSAYLNAPFKQLDILPEEENEELKKILDALDKLSLEDLDIPLVKVENTDLTTREVDGTGVFDFIGSSVMNQLEMMTNRNLISKADVANVYSTLLVQGLQTSAQYALEKANILNQSYLTRVQAVQAAIAVLQAKAQMLMLPVQLRLQYAQLEAQLKQVELLKVQTEIEKEKYPQIQAQTDLILAQTDAQRIQNEHLKEQAYILQEQVKQAGIATQLQTLQLDQQALANNKLVEDTKLTDAQTQLQLKQVMLADVQKVQAKAAIKLQAQQLEKEKEGLALVKAQTAAAYAQLAALEEQIKAAKAQYNDRIDGKPIGGVLGAQIAVNKAQAVGFERDAFIKFMNQAQSGWAAKKTADIATMSPSSYSALGVDRMMSWAAHKMFNMPADTFAMPDGYQDYITDSEMDGEIATKTSANNFNPLKNKPKA